MMDIIGTIVAVLVIGLIIGLACAFTTGIIKNQIEEAADKNAPPEVQEEQRQKAALEIQKALSQWSQGNFGNSFI